MVLNLTRGILILLALAGPRQGFAQQPLDDTERLLEELTNAHGVSGFEGEVREILRREWRELLPDLHTDGIGNLLGTLPGGPDGPRVLVMAHMDEVGFLVRHIDDDGFVYINNVGGYFAQSVLTQRLSILSATGRVVGYTGMKSGHILRPAERNQMVPLERMFIDVGASSRGEVLAMGIRPGLPVAYETAFEKLGDTGRYLAKAWDDRVGLAVITEALRELGTPSQSSTGRGDRSRRDWLERGHGRRGEPAPGYRHQPRDWNRFRLSAHDLTHVVPRGSRRRPWDICF